jgi:hypothetical protein
MMKGRGWIYLAQIRRGIKYCEHGHEPTVSTK